jgi:hypothetical protein
MRKIAMIIISLSALMIGVDFVRTLWLGKNEAPNEAYTNLTEIPARTVANPKANGYFLLLGFSSRELSDPEQTGYEMWLEVEGSRGHRFFDYEQGSRVALQVEDETLQALQAWRAPDAAVQLQALGAAPHSFFTQQAPLLDRYRRWMAMLFEDWGYGHPGCPRFADLAATHRLYVAEGFGLNVATGLDRLEKDLVAWRLVLAKARTLPLKVMAATVIQDDLVLLSQLLGSRDFDNALLPGLEPVVRPLTQAERSLRWPIQNEFVLGVTRFRQQFVGTNGGRREESEKNKRWLADAAGLPEDAFQKLDVPLPANTFSKGPAQIQKALNLYATYYEAVIQAADDPASPLPKLQDFVQASHRTFIDSLLNPADTVFASPGFEQAWEPFAQLMLETDARLRLAALQARIRKPLPNQQIAARIAQAGLGYYDPFSGLPMLWNPTAGRLYSVGKDGRDDEGDESQDISVAVPLFASAQPGTGH